MKLKPGRVADRLRPEYEFDYSRAVRGKHFPRSLKHGANVVILDPDVAKAFGDSQAVNEALRTLLRLAASKKRSAARPSRRPRVRRAAG
jgi:hypothetical protein